MLKERFPNIQIEVSNIEEVDTFRSNFDNLLSLLQHNYQINQLKNIGSMLSHISTSESPSKYIDHVSEKIHELIVSGNIEYITNFSQDVENLIKHITNQKSGELSGIPTGLSELDRHLRGLQQEDLIIVAGETSQGKTSMAISIAFNAAITSNPCLFISLEMSRKQLTARTMAQVTDISSKRMLYDRLENPVKEQLISKLSRIGEIPFYIDDSSGSRYSKIVSQIKRYVVQKGVKLVVVDYLQLINNAQKGINKEQEIGDIARGLKNLAKELQISIILLSQLSRNKDNPKPSVSRLRQSGQIEEAADIVILVYRPEHYGLDYYNYKDKEVLTQNIGICYVAKGRNVGTTDFLLGFEKELTKWCDLEKLTI
jgi:replicative DNA helicase